MNDRPQQKAHLEATYNRILDAAARIFEAKGYHGAKMQDIAAAAGLTKGGIYHHLTSKADTLFAINERYLTAGMAEIRRIADNGDLSCLNKIDGLALAIAAQHDDYGSDLRVALRESFSPSVQEHKRLVALRDEYESVVKQVFIDGVESGELIKMDPQLMVKFFFGSLNWMSIWYHPGPYSAREVGEAFSELLTRAMAADRPAT